MPASGTYLKPELLTRLRGLELRARHAAGGALAGMHHSAYRGFSVEFAEHRQYAPGDDLRYIDWRLFGRADRLYVKQYEEETNLRCALLLDASASMAYAGAGRASKWEYACTLAAGLAYLLVRQQDVVALLPFAEGPRAALPAGGGPGQLAAILEALAQLAPAGRTDLERLLHGLAAELRGRWLVVLISDLLVEPQRCCAGLEHLGHAGHELVVLHVMDDDEWNLPFVEQVQFEGLESDARLRTDPQALRASYCRQVRAYRRQLTEVCARHRADYVPVNTRDPAEVVLCGYLARRAGRLERGLPDPQAPRTAPGART